MICDASSLHRNRVCKELKEGWQAVALSACIGLGVMGGGMRIILAVRPPQPSVWSAAWPPLPSAKEAPG